MTLPETVNEDSDERLSITRYVPLGVVAAITPWNYPIGQISFKLGPALLAGNTVVLKPSAFTPLATLKLGEVLRDVVPDGVLNVVSGSGGLGSWMTEHPGFDKISFTGSTQTGRKVMASASDSLKRITLELGGNDPAIILPDVDVPAVAEQLFWAAFSNSGQICLAAKRVYIHADIYDEMKQALAAYAATVTVGDGTEEAVQLGPVSNRRQYETVIDLIRDAQEQGTPSSPAACPANRRGISSRRRSSTTRRTTPASSGKSSSGRYSPCCDMTIWRTPSPAPTPASTGSAPPSGPRTPWRRSPSGDNCRPARSGSTRSCIWRRWSRSAATSSQASAPRAAGTDCSSSPSRRPSPSGTPPRQRREVPARRESVAATHAPVVRRTFLNQLRGGNRRASDQGTSGSLANSDRAHTKLQRRSPLAHRPSRIQRKFLGRRAMIYGLIADEVGALMKLSALLERADVVLVAEAAEAEARRNGWAVTIAIVDHGGHLLALSRLDGAPPASAHVASAKANTAALVRRESKDFEDQINGGRFAFLSAPLQGVLEGGVPIMKDGECLGAVGVSGVLPAQDAEIARAGIAALKL
jgi:uncharacterized protein GlcG (DUF336 family)